MGKILWREWSYTQLPAMFYRVVVQTVLIFITYFLVLSAAMEKKMVGKHTEFLHKITGKRSQRNPDGTWVTQSAGVVLEKEGSQLEVMYIGRR